MSFWGFLKGLFGPKPVTRDVSRLDAGSADADAVREEVDLSGGPLKAGHRRRALRDPRLLPKEKKRFERKKKLMSREEADRLFAGTLRTKDRRVRDLLPDEEQLRRYGLPVWRTEADVAAALGVGVRTLRYYSIHRAKDPHSHYHSFAIPKRSGGERVIRAPKRRLKALQRKLLAELVEKLPVHDAAHGFRRGRSVASNARPHVGAELLLRFDLADFFPSITYGRVRGLLLALGYGYPVASTLAVLMTEAERQPVVIDGHTYFAPVGPRVAVQGAPTSPGIANALVLRLDRRLAGAARKLGFKYTRYADDLCFSSQHAAAPVGKLLGTVRRVVEAEGFRLNAKKTRTMRRGRRMQVTGVTVNETMGLSRTERRELRARIHQLGLEDPVTRGKLAYLSMLNPAQAEALRAHAKM